MQGRIFFVTLIISISIIIFCFWYILNETKKINNYRKKEIDRILKKWEKR